MTGFFDNEIAELFRGMLNEGRVEAQLSRLKGYHHETYRHSLRIGAGCLVLGKELLGSDLGNNTIFDDYCLRACGYSGLLHDIGKIILPKRILYNEGSLTQKDWEKIKKHPRKGYEMLDDFDEVTRLAVLAHHKFQRNSYPPEEISLDARAEAVTQVLTVSDHVNVMVNGRCYAQPVLQEEILGVLRREFTGDPKYIDIVVPKLDTCFKKSIMEQFISRFD